MTDLNDSAIQKEVSKRRLKEAFLKWKRDLDTVPQCGRATIVADIEKTRVTSNAVCVHHQV